MYPPYRLWVCSIERLSPCGDSPGIPYEPSSLLGASAQHVSTAAAPLPKVSLTIRPLPPWLARLVLNGAKTSFGTRQHAAAAACVWLQYAHGSVDLQPTCGGHQGAKVGCWILSTRSPYAITAWAMAQATISQHEILTRVLAHSSLIFSDADA